VTAKALRVHALRLAFLLAVVACAGAAGAVLRAQAEAPRMPLAQFEELHGRGGVVVLDVRSADQFRAGHIPGAISVPLDTVAARASEWRTATRPVVTYCS
jgi:3-mercaptopyruvate sulfurtransferase SseA